MLQKQSGWKLEICRIGNRKTVGLKLQNQSDCQGTCLIIHDIILYYEKLSGQNGGMRR